MKIVKLQMEPTESLNCGHCDRKINHTDDIAYIIQADNKKAPDFAVVRCVDCFGTPEGMEDIG